jgi:hypothetical protein
LAAVAGLKRTVLCFAVFNIGLDQGRNLPAHNFC